MQQLKSIVQLLIFIREVINFFINFIIISNTNYSYSKCAKMKVCSIERYFNLAKLFITIKIYLISKVLA